LLIHPVAFGQSLFQLWSEPLGQPLLDGVLGHCHDCGGQCDFNSNAGKPLYYCQTCRQKPIADKICHARDSRAAAKIAPRRMLLVKPEKKKPAKRKK
jgi:hypothetical protein